MTAAATRRRTGARIILQAPWILASCLLLGCGPSAEAPPPPNVVFIISDDHGYRDFGFMGSEIVQTPNLDRLAAEGVVFTHGFNVASVCAPSLRSLLTGLHPVQWDAQGGGLHPWVTASSIRRVGTLPRLLQRRGYVSFQGGKYWDGLPADSGFDVGTKAWKGAEATGLQTAISRLAGGPGLALGRTTMEPLWKFLIEHRSRPFFLWFAPMLPHLPFDPEPQFQELYSGKGLARNAQLYYANISRLDSRAGELLEYLDDNGLRETTIVIFLADNGWDQPPYEDVPLGGGPRGKLTMHELGVRTPIIVSWPGHVPQGVVDGRLVSALDLFPTVLDYAGLETPSDRTGISLQPFLSGTGDFARREVVSSMSRLQVIDESRPGQRLVFEKAISLRTDRWRYIRYEDRATEELYRVDRDPEERDDLAARHPEVAQRLRARVDRWIAEVTRAYQVDREVSSTPGPWNVIVLVPDTVRADHVSVNGYGRETTPHIDALAREGVNFRQAVTVAPRTWQSFSSILSGLYPPHHGVRFIFDGPLSPETPTLATLLGGAGWETAAFDIRPFLAGMTGQRGFGEYLEPKSASPGRDVVRRVGVDGALIERVLEWIQREREAPFLAFVRMSGGHWPYLGATPFESCEGQDHSFNLGSYGVEIGPGGKGVRLLDEDAFRKLIWTVDSDEASRSHMIAHYDGRLRETDAAIGHLIGGLREAGLLERSIVLVTSDHGESFGEHGYLQHGPRVDDPVMRVPLVVRLPRTHPKQRQGVVVEELVRVVDILPTVLDLLGIPVPEDLDGISLVHALEGRGVPPLWAYGESGRSFMGVDPELRLPGVEGKHRMIRTARWKLVFVPDAREGRQVLYDLRADPEERVDRSGEFPQEATRLRGYLEPLLAIDARPEAPSEPSPEQLEILRSLGYVQ